MGDYKKTLEAIGHKEPKIARFKKHNVPIERKHGLGNSVCRRCGKKGMGVISKYGLFYCRRCFREVSKSLGFRKYS